MVEDDCGWFPTKSSSSWWHPAIVPILKRGPMPQHVAFIMDGNRRYARSHLLPSVVQGHAKGFEQLTKILEWCRDLEIREVTIYAFSIENFKRSQSEVDGLMELFEKKLLRLLDETSKLAEKQMGVHFFGNLSYLPVELQKLAAKLELRTMSFKKSVINVCVAYTSQDEIRRAFSAVSRGISKGLLVETDISESLITKCLDSSKSVEPDLLIRTSGEKRLSDFLLWQCSTCYLHFDDVLWPDFGFWNLCKALFGYQMSYTKIQKIRTEYVEQLKEDEKNRVEKFLAWLEADKIEHLSRLTEAS